MEWFLAVYWGGFSEKEKIFQKNNHIFEKNICIWGKNEYNKIEEKCEQRRTPLCQAAKRDLRFGLCSSAAPG